MIRTMRELAAVVCASAALLLPAGAAAKTEREVGYTFEQAWPTAVRHLRVDEGFTITEKDEDVGYVVFKLEDDGRVFAGALELVRTERSGRKTIRLVLTIEDRPDYMEASVLDRMEQKLRHEHGDPPPPPEKKPPRKKPSKGKTKP